MTADPAVDPVARDVLGHRLAGLAEEMGTVLRRSARSVNIRERNDCSCALFDADGRLLAQAEHIPVHLGAMPASVAAARALGIGPGEEVLLNDPFRGGTHLPDLTLVTALAFADGSLAGYAASRAHHADVGGMAAGSMPAGASELFQEGLVIPPVRFTDEVRAMVLANCRSPVERDGDLSAQHAAGRLAAARLAELEASTDGGAAALRAGWSALLDLGEARTRAAIGAMADGTYHAEEWLEDDGLGSGPVAIRVAVTVAGDRLRVDFTGTDGAVAGNLNCPDAVTRSATLFAVRALTDPDLAANEGALRAIDLDVPAGSLIAARHPSAVAAGNVETSCRIADAVLAALGQARPDGPMAQGQGTCNNLALGVGGRTHYETLGGGQGAGPGGPGADGVHVTMSNTRNSPVEAIEAALPIRLVAYALRRGSGGAGRHRGGDGVIRTIRFLADGEFSLLAERRAIAPRGAAGGADGAPGEDRLDGEPIAAKSRHRVRAGEVLSLATPGGGGFGAPTCEAPAQRSG